MKAESIAECLGAFCNTFDLHLAIIGLENQFMVLLRVAVLDRFTVVGNHMSHFICVLQYWLKINDTGGIPVALIS